MKYCPTCKREYVDDSVIYCLADGVFLKDSSDPQTIIASPQPRITDAKTEVLPDNQKPEAVNELSRSKEAEMQARVPHSFLTPWAPRILSIVRIVVAFLIIQHGTQKLLGYPAQQPPPQPPPQAAQQAGQQPQQQRPAAQQGLPPLLLVASIIETFGGLLILLGLFTRPAAFILSGEMAVAYFYQHAPNSFWPVVNRGEQAVFYCFFFLYLFFVGAGIWSLDYLMRRRRATEGVR